MKKSILGLTVFTLSLSMVPSVLAQNEGVRRGFMARPTLVEERREMRLSGTPFMKRREMRLSGTPAMKLRLVRWVSLTAINGNALTVRTKSDKDFTVTVTSTTKLYRRFGAVAALSEFQVGDWLEIMGEWADTSKTSINALAIRNQSIQKANGTVNGTIVSVNAGTDTLVVQPNKRSDQITVTVTSTTKVYGQNKQQVIALTDIKAGDHVVVRGLWDRTNHTMTETVLVKDFSVPGPTK